MLQRDAFIEEIVAALEAGDKDIYFLSADFGAAALDVLREQYPKHFIHCGISEQNMIDVATGLALEGKKVFCYAMAPFISMRALEQIKCGPGIMNLPITLISVGVGLGYANSGPTHYVTEEFACMRSIIGSNIYTAADTSTARVLAKNLLANPKFAYVRLDRNELPEIEGIVTNKPAWRQVGETGRGKIALISHGKMFHVCVETQVNKPLTFTAFDIINSKPFPKDLVELLREFRGIIVLDEQTPSGSLGAAVHEACSNENYWPIIINITLPEKYLFENIGREAMLVKYGLYPQNIIEQSDRIDIAVGVI
jgi:transketolase